MVRVGVCGIGPGRDRVALLCSLAHRHDALSNYKQKVDVFKLSTAEMFFR